MNELNSSEAIMAFISWLSTRDKTIKLGAKHTPYDVIELIKLFERTNNLPEIRDNYIDFYEIPKE